MSGSYVAFRQAGLTEEAAFANRSSTALYGDGAACDSAEMLLHTEEQVRVRLDCRMVVRPAQFWLAPTGA